LAAAKKNNIQKWEINKVHEEKYIYEGLIPAFPGLKIYPEYLS